MLKFFTNEARSKILQASVKCYLLGKALLELHLKWLRVQCKGFCKNDCWGIEIHSIWFSTKRTKGRTESLSAACRWSNARKWSTNEKWVPCYWAFLLLLILMKDRRWYVWTKFVGLIARNKAMTSYQTQHVDDLMLENEPRVKTMGSIDRML